MTNRIQKVVGGDSTELMVGNVHRFCSKFLFEEDKIPADSAIIDDEEAVSIIADYRNEDEEGVTRDFNRYKGYQTIIFFQHFITRWNTSIRGSITSIQRVSRMMIEKL